MKRRKGFTLIELLVVIAIIALLVSILLPSVNRARELAKRAVCKTRLKGLGTAFELFAQAEGSWPYNKHDPTTAGNLALLVEEGYASGKNFVCPSTSDKNLESYEDGTDTDEFIGGWDDDGTDTYTYNSSYSFQASQSNDAGYSGTMIADGTRGAVAIMADNGRDDDDDGIPDAPDSAWSGITEDSDREAANSQNHSGDMQNVLFKAGHVSEEKRADCGYEDNDTDGPDAIFLWGDTTGPCNTSTTVFGGEGSIILTGDSVLVQTGAED